MSNPHGLHFQQDSSETKRTDLSIPTDRYVYNMTPHGSMRMRARRLQETEDQGVFCEAVSPRNLREASPMKVSPRWLRKHNLNKDNSNKHANVEGENS